jgi:hypothetical protein
MRVILLNGPARSGKDSLANAFAKFTYDVGMKSEIVKFAQPLKEMVHRAFNLPEAHDSQESVKDVKNVRNLGGMTPRQVYIAFSETFMKPMLGQGVFGRMLVSDMNLLQRIAREDMEPEADFFLVSDSGFAAEAREVVDAFGRDNIILVHLERDGYDFKGDSRGYIELPGVRTLKFNLGDQLSNLDDCVQALFIVAQGNGVRS